MNKPKPTPCFVDETGGDESTVQGIIEDHLAVENLNNYGKSNGEILLESPGIDSFRTTIEIRKEYDQFELDFPDGHIERAGTYSVGACTVAASTEEGGTIAVFVEGEFSFTSNDYVKTISPLSRSLGVSKHGYIGYISG